MFLSGLGKRQRTGQMRTSSGSCRWTGIHRLSHPQLEPTVLAADSLFPLVALR